MRSGAENKPTIFDALGFSTPEASALKIKAEILSAILEDVRVKDYTLVQLADILDEYQPSASNLLRGSISQVSIGKLLRCAGRLHLQTSIAVRPMAGHRRAGQSRAKSNARRSGRWAKVLKIEQLNLKKHSLAALWARGPRRFPQRS